MSISSIEVLTKDCLRVIFTEKIQVNTNFLSVENWSIVPFEDGRSVSVKRIFVGPGEEDITENLVEITEPSIDKIYQLSVDELITSSGNFIEFPNNTGFFKHRVTKTDSLLRTIPKLYDKKFDSNLRFLFHAIGREDDLIGGNLDELLPPSPALEKENDLLLIDTIEIVASGAGLGQLNGPVTSVRFGPNTENGQGFQRAVLSTRTGDLVLVCDFVYGVTGALGFNVEPNGSASNQGRYLVLGDGTGAVTDAFGADIQISGATLNVGTVGLATFELSTNRIVNRPFVSRFGLRQTGGVAAQGRSGVQGGTWEDTSTINFLDIRATIANGIGVGSLLSLYELKRRFD